MAHDAHGGHHIVPQKVLITVFASLIALTVLTVLTAKFVDIGAFNLPLALVIAGTKAMLVVVFFMALKYDSPINSLILGIGVVCVTVFLIFTLFDTAYRGDLPNVDAQTISDSEGRNLNQEYREAHSEDGGDH